jgi:hypothetical protein
MKLLIIAVILIIAVFIWWRFFYIARPAYPPLSIAPDDPLMRESASKIHPEWLTAAPAG